MDFSRKSNAGSGLEPVNKPVHSVPNITPTKETKRAKREPRWLRLTSVLELFAATLLIVSVIAFLVVNGKDRSEGKYVDKSKYQAVFMNRGDVYFGKITQMNSSYIHLQDVFSLNQPQTDQTKTATSQKSYDLISITRQVHCPTSEMVIYKDQTSYWENIQPEGQVVKLINEYKQQNPEQKCIEPSADSSQSNATQSNASPTTTQQTTTPNTQTNQTTPKTNSNSTQR